MSIRSRKTTFAVAGALIAGCLPVSLAVNTSNASALASVPYGGGNVRARLYQHANATGATITIFGDAPCTLTGQDRDFELGTMPSPHWWETWNDQVSSITAFNHCAVKLFSDGGFGGFTWGFAKSTTGLNVPDWMNDKASSFVVS